MLRGHRPCRVSILFALVCRLVGCGLPVGLIRSPVPCGRAADGLDASSGADPRSRCLLQKGTAYHATEVASTSLRFSPPPPPPPSKRCVWLLPACCVTAALVGGRIRIPAKQLAEAALLLAAAAGALPRPRLLAAVSSSSSLLCAPPSSRAEPDAQQDDIPPGEPGPVRSCTDEPPGGYVPHAVAARRALRP